MSRTTLIYCIICVGFCVLLFLGVGIEEWRIGKLKDELYQSQSIVSILRDNQEALQVEKTLQNQQLQSLKDLVEANKTQFEKFRQSEAERAELIEKLESVVVEKGQENKVGVITSESSDEVKELFNKQIKKFNGVH